MGNFGDGRKEFYVYQICEAGSVSEFRAVSETKGSVGEGIQGFQEMSAVN